MKMWKKTEPKKTEFQTAKNTPLSFRRSHGSAGALSIGFNSFDPSLLFRRSISDASIEAIRSATHLGLAR
jgi:hypothetical protein